MVNFAVSPTSYSYRNHAIYSDYDTSNNIIYTNEIIL